jgi:hypothetical protein
VLAVLLTAPAASATTLSFESLHGATPTDGTALSTQYAAAYGTWFAVDLDGDGVADPGVFPLFESAGYDPNGWAFVNDAVNGSDTAWAGTETELGDWMLAMPTHEGPMSLFVLYASPLALAGGTIWDIDGNAEQGTEQWRIDALGFDGAVLASIWSPLGEHLGADGLNAKPWHFAFEREVADVFGLRFEFVGSKRVGIGVAFDGISAAVPEPGTLMLTALGAAGLAMHRRRAP